MEAPTPIGAAIGRQAGAVLPKKSKAWYVSAGGSTVLVDIANVHYDDEPPYYTIHLADGVERSTIRSRLTPASDEDLAAVAAAEAKARAEKEALAANARSNEDAILEAIAMLGGVPPPDENSKPAVTAATSSSRGNTAGRRAPSPGRKRSKPKAPSAAAAPAWRDEKEAATASTCCACKGKKKAIYVQCVECTRNGVAEYRRVVCSQCVRFCETCEVDLCPTCKRDVHVSCRKCGTRCRRDVACGS